jgi:hypothetical protein
MVTISFFFYDRGAKRGLPQHKAKEAISACREGYFFLINDIRFIKRAFLKTCTQYVPGAICLVGIALFSFHAENNVVKQRFFKGYLRAFLQSLFPKSHDFKSFLKILRKRCGKGHVLFKRRMNERHGPCVERVAGKAFINLMGKRTVEHGQQ